MLVPLDTRGFAFQRERIFMSVLIDLTGMRVGRLTVVCRDGTYQRPSGNKEPTWRCVCDCGNEIVVISSNLKKANTLSFGCL